MTDRNWAMWLHLSLLANYALPLSGLIVAIVIWQMKKEEFPILEEHGKNAMNYFLSMLIYGVAAGLLCFVFVGFVLLPLLGLAGIALPVIAAIKANDGVVWPYPYMIRFFQ